MASTVWYEGVCAGVAPTRCRTAELWLIVISATPDKSLLPHLYPLSLCYTFCLIQPILTSTNMSVVRIYSMLIRVMISSIFYIDLRGGI